VQPTQAVVITNGDRHEPGPTIRRLARLLAAALTTCRACAAAPATPRPSPPGWNKHPPLPAHVQALATGAMPDWQITLIAVTAMLAAAILAATAGQAADSERDRRVKAAPLAAVLVGRARSARSVTTASAA
jgi:hypothetical protein